MYIGDPVVATGTGNQVQVAVAGTGNYILGAVVGVFDSEKTPGIASSTGARLNYKPASTAAYVAVADHPEQLFILSGDGAATAGINASGASSIIVASAGSTVSGRSLYMLAEGSVGTVVNNQIRIVRPVDRVDNDAAVKDADYYCFINLHQKMNTVVGTAV
jgi:hypothetical protein